MKKYILSLGLALPVLFSFYACSKERSNAKEVTVIKASGNIQDEMDAFRHLLGDQLNSTTGVTGGRREINWDGVPDSMIGKDLPMDFFNPTTPGSSQSLQRGLAYASPGQFRVSNSNFADINSNTAGEFQPFSGSKTFANISNNAWEIGIQKPGEAITASVQGFGVVFSDIDKANSTSLEFFDGSKSIGKFFAPPQDANTGFSFLGVYFNSAARITRIRVQHEGVLSHGQKDISANGTSDLVVLDDFLYSEPVVR